MNTLLYSKFTSSQTGAALITCLALLLVLTLIGLSSMTSTTLEEKMTGSVYNNNIARQSAEAVLIEAERTALNLALSSGLPNNPGYYPNSVEPGQNGYPTWANPAGQWANANVDTEVSSDNFQPSFMIEKYTETTEDEAKGYTSGEKVFNEQTIYRVTARSEGLNGNSTAMVQTTIRVLGGK